MQEEANQKTVGIVVQAGKFTMHEFGRACEKYSQYRRDKKRMRRTDPTKYKVYQPKKDVLELTPEYFALGAPLHNRWLQKSRLSHIIN